MRTHISATLNDLIRACIESARCYERSLPGTADDSAVLAFTGLAERHYLLALQLEAVVLQLGDEPVPESSRIATLHRPWQGLKDMALLGMPVQEMQRVEQRILDSYRTALGERSMPAGVRSLLHRHSARIQDTLSWLERAVH